MTGNLENFQDVQTDAKPAISPLLSEVNQERSNPSTTDAKQTDYQRAAEMKVNELFGSLQIQGVDANGPKIQAPEAHLAAADKNPAGPDVLAGPTAQVESAEATKAAATIEDSLHWYKSDDFDKVTGALQGKTPAEIKSLDDAFKKEHDGKGIEDTLKERWKDHPDQLAKAVELLHPKEAVPPVKPEPTADEIKAKDAQALESLKKDPEVQAKHEEMAQRAKETMKNPELSKFLDNMDKLEAREASVQGQYQKEFEAPPHSMQPEQAAKEAEKRAHDQIKGTYGNVERLLAHDSQAPVHQNDRVLLAQQVMQHAAEPTSISQGRYGTCNVTTVESRTFTRDPAAASALVADVATKGEYTPKGQHPITLDSQSLLKQGESTEATSGVKDGKRDFASQLFEVTAVNVMLAHKNGLTDPPGQLRYEQHKDVKGHNKPPDDNGERLMDYATHPPTVVQKSIGMSTADINLIAKTISPAGSEGVVALDGMHLAELQKTLLDCEFRASHINGGKPADLTDPDWARKAHEAVNQRDDLDTAGKLRINHTINDLEKQLKEDHEGSVIHVHNEQEMKDMLAKLKDSGKLPVVVGVDTNNEPFWTDSRGGDAGGAGGQHVVTITDYNKETGVAKMENQWDGKADHDITAKQLFEASRDPKDTIELLKKETTDAKNAGHRDYVKELELLRFEKQDGLITDAEYDQKTIEQTIDRFKEFKDGKIDPNSPEYLGATKELVVMLNNLDISDKPADHQRADAIRNAIKGQAKEIAEHKQGVTL